MSYSEKKEMLKFVISLNLFIGIYNFYLFGYANSIVNLVIGSLNIGVWIFFRDMKLIHIFLKNKYNNR